MRAISLVDRLEFQFNGNVARNAIALGDVDNDGLNELIIGNNHGEVTIFKGKEKLETISDLNFVGCVGVGDIFNRGQNYLVVLTTDGWCCIYDCKKIEENLERSQDETDGLTQSSENTDKSENNQAFQKYKTTRFERVYLQRIPANVKNILLDDVDNDGKIEMILGLTDRVVRSYRWLDDSLDNSTNCDKIPTGKLIALNKWECANQIGSITLHNKHSNRPALLIAQPGGTFMRIWCQDEETSNSNESESSTDSTIDYQFLGISRMRNPNISTEIVGDLKTDPGKTSPYTVATLDGTIMLVRDETILWAMAVDHQIFALSKLDVTGNGVDDIVACAWDGQTYILDQEKNSVRFHLEEPVQAFACGFYNISTNEKPVTCFVYVTFKNAVYVYYDIPLKELVCRRFEADLSGLKPYLIKRGKTEEEAEDFIKNMDKTTKTQIIKYLLHNIE